MCNFIINKWIGRNGNNILFTLSAIDFCIKNNYYKLVIPKHDLFNLKSNIIILNGCKCNKIKNKLDINNGNINNELDIEYLKELFNKYINCNFSNKINNEYYMSIHIRSGDIFNNNPHSFYIPLPLDYYIKLINNYIEKKICIVYEDTRNPVINILKKKYLNYKNINFQSCDLKSDIISLSNCKILVISIGTFFYLPYLISKTIDKIIIPNFLSKENKFGNFKNTKVFETINLNNYIKLGEWKNSKEQIYLILNYKI